MQAAPLGQMQFSLPSKVQFPVQFPFTLQELLSPAKGQEMPDEFKTRAIPASSRTSATIGYLFIIYPLLLSQPLPYETEDFAFSIYISLCKDHKQASKIAVRVRSRTMFCINAV
jgi:hypothetical protein